jgi:hypothetical protein
MNISMAVQTGTGKKSIFVLRRRSQERMKVGIGPGGMAAPYCVMAALTDERHLSGQKP